MSATLHDYHLQQIVDRLEGHPVRRIDTCGRWDRERDERCGKPATERLVSYIAWREDTVGVCEDHLREHLERHLLLPVAATRKALA